MGTPLTQLLNIKYPIIVAPMFLISNKDMVIEALKIGVTAAIPALNYRSMEELRENIREIRKHSDKAFGINLIVNKSNFKYKKQLQVLLEEKIAFIITSLGNPNEVIEKSHKKGIKVFCDVTDLKYAKKVEALGADAIIAVNSFAGGHLGHINKKKMIETLKSNCKIPIISAGGVGTGKQVKEVLDIGADGLSIGTIFIASKEAKVSDQYKQAMVKYGAKDIVVTTKLSGTPLTVINTPFVQLLGTKQNFLEWLLNKNKRLKKISKMILAYQGMKKIKNAALKASYQNVWCAGVSIEHVHEIRPMRKILENLIAEIK